MAYIYIHIFGKAFSSVHSVEIEYTINKINKKKTHTHGNHNYSKKYKEYTIRKIVVFYSFTPKLQ